MEGVIILVILIVITLISSGDNKSNSNYSSNNSYSSSRNSNSLESDSLTSPYAKSISIGTGNASYVYQPRDEYITIYNRGNSPIDITGWQLQNGKDERAYYLSGSLQRFTADVAYVPQSPLFISPSGNNSYQNVVLQSGENAILTTGSIGSALPYKITSFKENICSGYLQDMPEYNFTPSLNRNCPQPRNEIGLENLDAECRRFVENISTCHTPTFNPRDNDGEPCSTCVDGKRLSNSCYAYIKDHFNYGSCIAYHRQDENFFGRTWRVFLNKGWEMWAKEYETIKIFDKLGRLVNTYTY